MEKPERRMRELVDGGSSLPGVRGRLKLFKNILEKPLDRCLRVCYNGIANKKKYG